jgi:hypothetical protein
MIIYRSQTLPAIYDFRSPAPLLEHLEVSGDWYDRPAQLPDDFLGRHAPSLRYLRFECSPLLSRPFPLPNLTELSMFIAESQTPMNVVVGLLSSAPRLEKVSITLEDIAMGESPILDIHLGSLRYLEVKSGSTFSRVFPHIKAPKLEVLALFFPAGVQLPTIKDLLPPESYPLTAEVTSMEFLAKDTQMLLEGKNAKISLIIDSLTPAALDDFVSNAPSLFAKVTAVEFSTSAGPFASRIAGFQNLRQVKMVRCIEEDVIFEALCPSLSSELVPSTPCPRLEEMEIELHSEGPSTPGRLVRMIRSREQAGYPLQEVELPSLYGFSAEHVKVLEVLGSDYVPGL